jgi:hypothetical protein
MDTLTIPVLLVTRATNSRKAGVGRIATNSRRAGVFYRAVLVLYIGQKQRARVSSLQNQSESVESPESVRPSLSVPAESPRSETSAQCSSVSGI